LEDAIKQVPTLPLEQEWQWQLTWFQVRLQDSELRPL